MDESVHLPPSTHRYCPSSLWEPLLSSPDDTQTPGPGDALRCTFSPSQHRHATRPSRILLTLLPPTPFEINAAILKLESFFQPSPLFSPRTETAASNSTVRAQIPAIQLSEPTDMVLPSASWTCIPYVQRLHPGEWSPRHHHGEVVKRSTRTRSFVPPPIRTSQTAARHLSNSSSASQTPTAQRYWRTLGVHVRTTNLTPHATFHITKVVLIDRWGGLLRTAPFLTTHERKQAEHPEPTHFLLAPRLLQTRTGLAQAGYKAGPRAYLPRVRERGIAPHRTPRVHGVQSL
ncbi:hypothetical protein CCMSSC00406_0010190 [Pleurotus cornucopiae]|uniref:Uncharacterized protein n=1 Tax=Pleurotus cornucopiae TaxID=5321 RepID=A0ACB7IND0_PLECO|nr:hypothetical protein CCMSSC00406_0010190 [Pleurotus cornucopiae]